VEVPQLSLCEDLTYFEIYQDLVFQIFRILKFRKNSNYSAIKILIILKSLNTQLLKHWTLLKNFDILRLENLVSEFWKNILEF